MPRMHSPPHPGKALRDALGDMDVTTAARKLQVSRTTLSRVLNGAACISVDMSIRLSAALRTHGSLWYELQMSYDMAHAARRSAQNSSDSKFPPEQSQSLLGVVQCTTMSFAANGSHYGRRDGRVSRRHSQTV